MSWITDAGRRFWQAYCEGLEMSCPLHEPTVHTSMAEKLAQRFCERDRPHDAAARPATAGQSTVH